MDNLENTQQQSMTATQEKGFGLSSTVLKYIAITAMLIDHLASAFVPYGSTLYPIMRFIGRITGPVMFYSAVEGYRHTRNVGKYMLRMLVFAVVSYIPFVCFMTGYMPSAKNENLLTFNVMYTILMGLVAVHVRHKIRPLPLKIVIMFLLVILTMTSDWAYSGVIIILIFDIFYGNFKYQAVAYSLFVLFKYDVFSLLVSPFENLYYDSQFYFDSDISLIVNLGMFLPIILLSFYNGKKGNGGKFSKWLFYIFYPLHLLIIVLVRDLIAK